MKLTPEQLGQCRTEFEEWQENEVGNAVYDPEALAFASTVEFRRSTSRSDAYVWYSAWRPRLIVEEIVAELNKGIEEYYTGYETMNVVYEYKIDDIAQAIYRAQGGEDE